ALQAVGLGTAVALVAAATPSAASPLRLGTAALVALLTIGLLTWERTARRIAELTGPKDQFRPLPLVAVAESAGLSLLSWITYGVAFWLLARGLGLPGALPVARAAGVFALGYILGLLALFAPGGVGVREVVLIGLLTRGRGGGAERGLPHPADGDRGRRAALRTARHARCQGGRECTHLSGRPSPPLAC